MKALINGVWCSDLSSGDAPEADWRSAALMPYPCRNSRYGDLPELLDPEDCHLYVSIACPFAHRVVAARELLGLQDALSMSVLDPDWSGPHGWVFSDHPGCTPDTVNGKRTLYEIYTLGWPDFTGKVTVPALWSKRDRRLISIESLDILRLLSTGFRPRSRAGLDLCPALERAAIDELNTLIDSCISNAVYRVRAAIGSGGYEREMSSLFDALAEIEMRLEGREYLVGGSPTEPDLVLFATMLRFDVVYFERFGCNRLRLAQLPNIAAHTMRIAGNREVARTINFDHIIKHYFTVPEFAYSRGPILEVRREASVC